MPTLRLGTRTSLLAQSQSALVAADLRLFHPDLQIVSLGIQTSGDKITDRPLYDAGGKGLFIKELELALLKNQIDFAVHSCKDLPVTMPLVEQTELIIAAIPAREDPRDVLISMRAKSISELPKGASVATGSLRRRCQLLALRPDLKILPLRGNIDTRIKKLKAGEADAIILALAGIKRAHLFDESIMHPIATDDLLPAPGQAALAIQCRRVDELTRSILLPLEHPESRTAIEAERAVVAALHCDCHSPIAVYAQLRTKQLMIQAALGQRDGNPPVKKLDAQGSNAVDQIVGGLAG
jgi:hydroxymethylbilane synthase